MKYVVLVSHGMMAPGMHSALSMLAGENREDILSSSLENGMGADEFAEKFRKVVSVVKDNDEILMFADLVCGSPLTTAANVIAEEGFLDRTVMIGGMNMPLVLSAVIMKDTMSTEELITTLLPEAREELKEFRITAETEEDEI